VWLAIGVNLIFLSEVVVSIILTPVVLSTIFTSKEEALLSLLHEQEALSKGQEGPIALERRVDFSLKRRVEMRNTTSPTVMKTKVIIITDFLFMVIEYNLNS